MVLFVGRVFNGLLYLKECVMPRDIQDETEAALSGPAQEDAIRIRLGATMGVSVIIACAVAATTRLNGADWVSVIALAWAALNITPLLLGGVLVWFFDAARR